MIDPFDRRKGSYDIVRFPQAPDVAAFFVRDGRPLFFPDKKAVSTKGNENIFEKKIIWEDVRDINGNLLCVGGRINEV